MLEFLDISKIKDSTHAILKKDWKVEIELSINSNVYKDLVSVSEYVRKIFWNLLTQLIEFTGQQKRLKK